MDPQRLGWVAELCALHPELPVLTLVCSVPYCLPVPASKTGQQHPYL